MDTLGQINTEFKQALSYENKYAKITALSNLAKNTASSSIPIAIKDRILKTISEHNLQIVGLMDRDLNPCFEF